MTSVPRMSIRVRLLVAGGLLALALPSESLATASRTWVLRSRGDFQNMKMEGVSLSPEGELSVSARATMLADGAQPSLWCLARDPKGRLYAGTGNDGRVLRLPAGGAGEPEVLFDAPQLGVHAIAFDSKGRLFAATAPRGGVHLITPEGLPVLIFDPGDHYIWAMAFDAKDRLYVATGQKGRVYRIDSPGPGASATTVLDGNEDHIRSMAVAADGTVFAGSDQSGIIYRIDPAGKSAVVFDSPMREIAALSVMTGPGGQEWIFAAALAPMPRQGRGGGGSAPSGVTRVRVTADDPGGEAEPQPESGSEGQQAQDRREGRPPQAAEAYFGAIYRLTRAGLARRIWESREMLPLSFAVLDGAPARLVVGTGNEGRVLTLDESGAASDLATVSGQQVTALLPGGDGSLLAATCNLGQVHRLGLNGPAEGTITSNVHDAGVPSSWGAIGWSAEIPRGASVALQVRTGDTETPDGSWSEWSGRFTEPEGSRIDRPRGRYLQWRATLARQGEGAGPTLRGVRISYLQDNVSPEVTSVEVLSPGVVLSQAPGGNDRSAEEPPEGGAARRTQNPPRRSFERGRRSASWKSEDANDDALKFNLYFRAEDEKLWKPLARQIETEFHSWDATAMPDGLYRIKVEATDAASNPAGAALAGTLVSAPFEIDNTPPAISALKTRVAGREVEASFTVTDAFSLIGEVEFSIDAGDWSPVPPEGRIADDRTERYALRAGPLEPGEHTVTVRARDRAGNLTAGRAVVVVD